MVGFVGCLVILGDIFTGIFTVLLVAFNVASVLDPAAFCTVWNVERRVVCVVISIVVIGFFVTNFVVSLIVFAEVCVLCVFKNPDIVVICEASTGFFSSVGLGFVKYSGMPLLPVGLWVVINGLDAGGPSSMLLSCGKMSGSSSILQQLPK